MKKIINEIKLVKNNNTLSLKKVVNEINLGKNNIIVRTNTIIEKGHIKLDFNSETANGSIIGSIPNGAMIDRTVVIVDEIGTGEITVGTDDAQGILQNANQNDLTELGYFEVGNNLLLSESTSFKLFLNSNTAVGSVIIYYS